MTLPFAISSNGPVDRLRSAALRYSPHASCGHDRSRLLAKSNQSVENLKRLQAQIVQSEKLVSLGSLPPARRTKSQPLAAIPVFRPAGRRSHGSGESSRHRLKNPRPGAPHKNFGGNLLASLSSTGRTHAPRHQHRGEQCRAASCTRLRSGPTRIGCSSSPSSRAFAVTEIS